MAAAKSVLGDLLRLATSVRGGTFYLCAACIALQQQQRPGKDVERANEALLASLLQQLERDSASFFSQDASSVCEGRVRGDEGGEEEGNGVGNGGWREGEGEEGVWAGIVQLFHGVTEDCAREGPSQTLLGFISDCRHFQASCNRFLLAALAVGCSCGILQGERLDHFLEQFHEEFWSSRIDLFAKHVGSIDSFVSEDKTSIVNVFCSCLKHISFLHVLQEIQRTLISAQDVILSRPTSQTSLHRDGSRTTLCNMFLCESISNPLAAGLARTVPQVLHAVYRTAWNNDHKSLSDDRKIPTANKEGVGLILKSGHQLDSSLVLFGTVLGQWTGTGTVQEYCLETILRLSNLHLKNLSEVIHLVPEHLPPRVWYVIINSAICLHSMLTCLQSILNPTLKYTPLFSQLLHTITEFTNTLTTSTITYHTHLLRYSLLHDADSNNWADPKPFSEGERCSLTIQMWQYHLRGLHSDLWSVGGGGGGGRRGGGEVMVRILRDVLCDSVCFLERRYSDVKPSYGRTEQFKADILALLVGVAFFLPHISSPLSPSPPHTLTNLTTSSLSLLHTLTVITTPLEHLLTSLTSPHTPHTPTPSQPHISPFTLSQKLSDYLDLSHFGIPATSNQSAINFLNFVSLPYPSWNMLLKLVLAEEEQHLPSLLVAMATNQHLKGEELEVPLILDHICRILSQCVCQPQALAKLLLCTRGETSMDETCTVNERLRHRFRSVYCREWLICFLKESLHQHVVTWASVGACDWSTCEGVVGTPHRPSGTTDDEEKDGKSVSMDVKNSGVSMVTEHILRLLDTLDSAISQLPSPVTFVLSQLAEEASSLNGGPAVAEVLGTLLSEWLNLSPPLPPSLSPDLISQLTISLSLVSWTLNGANLNDTKSTAALPPSIFKALKGELPLIKHRLQSFGSAVTQSSPHSIPADLAHSIIANMLQTHPGAELSLHYIYQWLRLRKDCILKLLVLPSDDHVLPSSKSSLTPPTTGFNPLEVGVSLGNRTFDHQ